MNTESFWREISLFLSYSYFYQLLLSNLISSNSNFYLIIPNRYFPFLKIPIHLLHLWRVSFELFSFELNSIYFNAIGSIFVNFINFWPRILVANFINVMDFCSNYFISQLQFFDNVSLLSMKCAIGFLLARWNFYYCK